MTIEHNGHRAIEAPTPRRFAGLDRLYHAGFVARLQHSAQAIVVGVGGVGSWAAEALARSGVGRLVLIDMDHVSESNINRQLQANDANLGKSKIDALAAHIHGYAPQCHIIGVDDFINDANAETLLAQHISLQHPHCFVLCCCDQVRAKLAIIEACQKHAWPLVLAGSAGGKTQSWLVKPADLSETTHDPLLAKLRTKLRAKLKAHSNHANARQATQVQPLAKSKPKKIGVTVFYSPEPVRLPQACGSESELLQNLQAGLNCAGYGSMVSVTAAMGMGMAAHVMNAWAKLKP